MGHVQVGWVLDEVHPGLRLRSTSFTSRSSGIVFRSCCCFMNSPYFLVGSGVKTTGQVQCGLVLEEPQSGRRRRSTSRTSRSRGNAFISCGFFMEDSLQFGDVSQRTAQAVSRNLFLYAAMFEWSRSKYGDQAPAQHGMTTKDLHEIIRNLAF